MHRTFRLLLLLGLTLAAGALTRPPSEAPSVKDLQLGRLAVDGVEIRCGYECIAGENGLCATHARPMARMGGHVTSNGRLLVRRGMLLGDVLGILGTGVRRLRENRYEFVVPGARPVIILVETAQGPDLLRQEVVRVGLRAPE